MTVHGQIIDTGVGILANGRDVTMSPQCQLTCIDFLEALVRGDYGPVVLDDAGEILTEYERHFRYVGQPGLGDYFYRWILLNIGNPERVQRFDVPPEQTLAANAPGLDRGDLKFIALALSCGGIFPIVVACDTDWLTSESTLQGMAVSVQHLCRDELSEIVDAKAMRKARRSRGR